MLKLAGLNEVGCVETDGQYEIEVTVTSDAPKCGCLLPNLRKNGRRKSMFNDTPIHGKRVGIWVQRQRYQCTNCQRTLYETVPHMSQVHDMTERLVKYIQHNGTERTFTALAGEIGIDVQTVRRIWRLHAEKELNRLTPVTPEWMGIDELHIMHGYTEGFNSVARMVDRMGRGYSFKVLRARLLLRYSCHKQAKPPRMFSRGSNRDKEFMRRVEMKARQIIHDLGPGTGKFGANVHLGVDLSTLAKWLESLPKRS